MEMPDNIKDAVVAAENRGFWTSTAASTPRASCRAVFNNASGNSVQGASTITQQYVKILYLTQELWAEHAQGQGSDPVAEGPAAGV